MSAYDYTFAEDVIEIEEVALHNSEWDEKVYSVNSSIMDGVSITVFIFVLYTMCE